MSGGTNNFNPYPRHWLFGQAYDDHLPNSSEGSLTQAPFSQAGSLSFRVNPGASRAAPNPRHAYDERMMTGPYSLVGLPELSYYPGQVLEREFNPSRRQIILASPPGSSRQQRVQVPTHEDDSKLTQEGQQIALKKLRKILYDPPPKKRRPNVYYRLSSKEIMQEMQKEKEINSKNCAVCLEDFEPKEMVTLTPCEHMFHEACIVPWVRSQGQCPVCRFVLSEQKKQNNRVNAVAADNPVSAELISVIRAIEEASLWDSFARLYLS